MGSVRVDLEGKWSGTLLRTRTALARKCVPEAEQLEELAFEGQPPAGAITAMPKGFRIKNPVSVGHILVRSDLEPIPVINAGDAVRLTLFSDFLSVSTQGTARSSGALGESVRVELSQAKRHIQAVVQGPGEAHVEWK
jgi:flagella basal body P-ring formation protein FlgA